VLTRLWSGETVSFEGRHYRVDQVAFQPTPVQRPRIPIWVAGAWPRRGPLRRAARFEGSCPLKVGDSGELVVLDPGDVRELRAVVDRHRADPAAPFDVLLGGSTPEDPWAARAMLEPLAEAGMTWWQECVDPRQTDLAAFRRRVRQGPPGT
jgi:alkanesulfonate monooxygenase SsuD/methylene tetrahydromethanopterin reductase-like flavin-dependent oxidoreductase (luciferase family)